MYTNWIVNDIVSIGLKVKDFCGVSGNNFLYMGYQDMELYPTTLNILCDRPNCSYYCLDTRNREVVFYSCMDYHSYTNDVNCANRNVGKFYREIGRIMSDGRGIASFNHSVTEQDRADYNDAINLGGVYNIVACMNAAEATAGHAINFGSVSISPAPPVTAHHAYIEYDVSFLPSDFIDFIGSNITTISGMLGPRLPSFDNIIYERSEYASGKFRIYVTYMAPASAGYSMGYSTGYESLGFVSLSVFAGLIAGIIIFILLSSRLTILGPWGLAASAVLAVVGAVSLGFTIYDITDGTTTTGTTPKVPPDQKQKIIGDYSNEIRAKCLELNPGCNTGNCTATNMTKYNVCIGAIDLAEYTSDENAKGTFDENKYNEIKNKVQNVDTCLTNGTCTPTQAAQQVIERTTTVINNNTETVTVLTCPSGWVYNKDKKGCEEECFIPMFGYCVLSRSAAKTLGIAGGLLLGGYVIYKIATREKVVKEKVVT